MLKSLSLAERMFLEEDRMPFQPGTKWDIIRDEEENTLHDLMSLIESLKNPEVRNAILEWHAYQSKRVAKGHAVINWGGLESILDNYPDLKKQFRDGCPDFAERLKAREAYIELEKRNGNSAQSTIQTTRAKVFTLDEERAILRANPFYGPLLQVLEAKKNGNNGQ